MVRAEKVGQRKDGEESFPVAISLIIQDDPDGVRRKRDGREVTYPRGD